MLQVYLTMANDVILSTITKYMIHKVAREAIYTIYVTGDEKTYLQLLLQMFNVASRMTSLHWIWLNNAFQDSTCWRAVARSVTVNAHRNNLEALGFETERMKLISIRHWYGGVGSFGGG